MKLRRSFWLALLASVCWATTALAQEESVTPKEAHEGKSADELAKELNNPNNDVAKLTFKFQYRWYEGDLPGACSAVLAACESGNPPTTMRM